MSHFSVMVINSDGYDNVDEQLQPFSEHIETEPVEEGIVSESEKEHFMEIYKTEHPEDADLSFEELYEKHGSRWNGNMWVKGNDGEWIEFTTYNPDSKWDWYEIGGRWCGFLKVKDTEIVDDISPSWGWTHNEEARQELQKVIDKGVADQTTKGNVDWEGMMEEGRKSALETFDKVAEYMGLDERGHVVQPKVSWEECVKQSNQDFQKARGLYHSQPVMERFNEMNKNRELGIYASITDFDMTREQYGELGANNSISTFAVLLDGSWYEQGEMGMFGMSSATDEDQMDWAQGFYDRFIKDLPDDALITIVDCHI